MYKIANEFTFKLFCPRIPYTSLISIWEPHVEFRPSAVLVVSEKINSDKQVADRMTVITHTSLLHSFAR